MSQEPKKVRNISEIYAMKAEELESSERLPDGRYLPYMGGSMGWYENQGVPKQERSNNYNFHTIFESAMVRQKLFQRWGEDLERRSEDRNVPKAQVGVSLQLETGPCYGLVKDYSVHGMRLEFADQVVIKKGDMVNVNMHTDPKKKKESAMTVECVVVWSTMKGTRSPIWIVGVGFVTTNPEEEKKLKALLA